MQTLSTLHSSMSGHVPQPVLISESSAGDCCDGMQHLSQRAAPRALSSSRYELHPEDGCTVRSFPKSPRHSAGVSRSLVSGVGVQQAHRSGSRARQPSVLGRSNQGRRACLLQGSKVGFRMLRGVRDSAPPRGRQLPWLGFPCLLPLYLSRPHHAFPSCS